MDTNRFYIGQIIGKEIQILTEKGFLPPAQLKQTMQIPSFDTDEKARERIKTLKQEMGIK